MKLIKLIVGIVICGFILYYVISHPHVALGILKRLFTALWALIKWTGTKGIPYVIDVIKDIIIIVRG